MKNKTDISKILITDKSVVVEFKDGTVGEELFSSYPRLKNASVEERNNYTSSYYGLHWSELDEDLSFEGFYRHSVAPASLTYPDNIRNITF